MGLYRSCMQGSKGCVEVSRSSIGLYSDENAMQSHAGVIWGLREAYPRCKHFKLEP